MYAFQIYIIIKHKFVTGNILMKNLLYYISLLSAKTAIKLIKLKGTSKGTSAPGMIAMKICPDFIKQAGSGNKKKIITVTGTNGKTTTTGLLAHIVKESGEKIIHNTEGANMLTGIATALAANCSFNTKSDYLIFESDEAYLRKLYDYISADYLLVTNLFRDQLDRYGELDITFKKIKEAISKNKDLKVFINADDPTLEGIAGDNKKIYFGLSEVKYDCKTENSKAPSENTDCPKCSEPLIYDKRFYAHIGHYYCNCGYRRHEPDYSASAKIYGSYSEISVKYNGNTEIFTVNLPGLYNVYNALGAIAVSLELGINPDVIRQAFKTYSSVFGRAQTTEINGKKALIQLIKNPVGASEVIRQIQGFEKSKLLIILNDNYADGRDVSWIWDADFEALSSYREKITVSGQRAYDAALRLKYAGIDKSLITVEEDIQKALSQACENTKEDETLLILPTYTALLKMQNLMK